MALVEGVETEMPISFAQEKLEAIWDEVLPLARLNQLETGALSPDDFKPDRERFLAIEKAGIMPVFTARREDNLLVGYAVFLVSPHLHYSALVWAMQDVLFVHPEHRGVGAVRFILRQDDALKASGVQVIARYVSARHDYEKTLLGIGYSPIERAYIKRV